MSASDSALRRSGRLSVNRPNVSVRCGARCARTASRSRSTPDVPVPEEVSVRGRRARRPRPHPSVSTAEPATNGHSSSAILRKFAVACSRPSTAVSPRLMRCVITNAGGMFAARDVRVRTVRVEVHAHGLRRVLGVDGEHAVVHHELVEVAEVAGHVGVGERGIAPEHVVRFHQGPEARNVVLHDERADQGLEQRRLPAR